MNSLDKYKLKYEYNQKPRDIRKAFSLIRRHQREQFAEITKKAKSGTPLKELAEQYKMSVQKIVSIVRKK